MDWYNVFSSDIEKWITLAFLIINFGLILYRKFNIAYVSLGTSCILILLGIVNPSEALVSSINWDVLAIYWGYGILAITFRQSKMPTWIANRVLSKTKSEKQALLFLCAMAMVLSSFMANPVVVIMLAPLAIEIATRLKASLFLYLIAIAISSNVVTTVTMIADPPALILATNTGMDFLDFYWFQDKISLGTLSIIGLAVAFLTLMWQVRKLRNRVDISLEKIQVSWTPLVLFIVSILALALVPWHSLGIWNHPGLVGFILGICSLIAVKGSIRSTLREFDWNTIAFLVGIFIVIDAVSNTGLLADISLWLGDTGLKNPTVYLAIFVWISVFLSSFIDNVPYTILMLPVCSGVAQMLGVSPFPFLFGMLVGTGIGGNLTPVGATANVLACGILEKRGIPIQLKKYFALAIPFSFSAVLIIHVLLQFIWLD